MGRPALADQVVVVIGASSGLGRQVACDLADGGATVVVAARRGDVLEELAEDLRRRGARDALAVPCDVADDAQVQHLVRATCDHFGRIDTFMVMPGLAIYAPVEHTTVAEYERMIDVLLLGYIRAAKAALPVLRRQGHGVLVMVTSALGEGAVPLQSAYVAAKHGVVGFTRTLQMEAYKAPFQVCLVLPGSMATPLQVPHARSKTGFAPKPVPPVVHPAHDARKIVRLCTRPRETLYPDLQSWFLGSVGPRVAPRLMQRLTARFGVRLQMTDQPEPVHGHDNVDAPMPEGASITGGQEPTAQAVARRVRRHPVAAGVAAVGAAAGLAAAVAAGR